jgi:hypothetical protein
MDYHDTYTSRTSSTFVSSRGRFIHLKPSNTYATSLNFTQQISWLHDLACLRLVLIVPTSNRLYYEVCGTRCLVAVVLVFRPDVVDYWKL